MGKYIYELHMGGLYATELQRPRESLYCETCGDSDWELGYCENRAEAKERIGAMDIYTNDYIKEFLDENFPEDEVIDNG